MINKFSILNRAKYFPLGIFQNYLVFTLAKKMLNTLLALLGFNHGNLMEYRNKVLKIQLIQKAICTNLIIISCQTLILMEIF